MISKHGIVLYSFVNTSNTLCLSDKDIRHLPKIAMILIGVVKITHTGIRIISNDNNTNAISDKETKEARETVKEVD